MRGGARARWAVALAVPPVVALVVLLIHAWQGRMAEGAREREVARSLSEARRRASFAAATALAALPPSSPSPEDLAASPLPESLRGTEVDGAIEVDAQGNLVPGAGLKHFFEYFLSATGEEPTAVLRARIRAALAQRLRAPALDQAQSLLDSYLEMREASRSLEPHGRSSVEDRLAQVQALRTQYLGADVEEAMFGDEDRQNQHAAARYEVMNDASLSPEERTKRLAALDAELPASEREARAAMMAPVDLLHAEQGLRGTGGSDGDVQTLREKTVGPEAAERLRALDQERQHWDARVEAFAAEDAQENGVLLPDEHAKRRLELLQRLFTPNEQVRVQALARLGRVAGWVGDPATTP